MGFGLFCHGSIGAGKIYSKIDKQPLALIIFQFDLPPSRWRQQNIDQEQRSQQSHGGRKPHEVLFRGPSDVQHSKSSRQKHKCRAQIRFLENQNERQEHHPDCFPKHERITKFVSWAAEEVGLSDNESEFRELRGLKEKKF